MSFLVSLCVETRARRAEWIANGALSGDHAQVACGASHDGGVRSRLVLRGACSARHRERRYVKTAQLLERAIA